MIELTFGIVIGMTIATLCPKTFGKVKEKILNLIHNENDCSH